MEEEKEKGMIPARVLTPRLRTSPHHRTARSQGVEIFELALQGRPGV